MVRWLTAVMLLFAWNASFAKEGGDFDLAKLNMVVCEGLLETQKLAMQISPPANRDLPTFLFLPGTDRSLFLDYEAMEDLASDGFGLVAMNFSPHPFSIALGSEVGKAPVTLETLAKEVEKVVEYLKREHRITKVIPVSGSFSGGTSIYLRNFPLIIEASPLTAMAAYNPRWAAFRSSLQLAETFNPLFGKTVTRNSLDQLYRQLWSSNTDEIIEKFNLPREKRWEILEGYVSLARSAEGFAWENIEACRASQRIFILGENEAPTLLQHQKETAERLTREGYNIQLHVLKDAGHRVWADQPKIYAQILRESAKALAKHNCLWPIH